MTKQMKQGQALLKPAAIQSLMLGKHFRLDQDPEVYQVMGLKGRTRQVVLQVPSTERILILSEDEFLAQASEIV